MLNILTLDEAYAILNNLSGVQDIMMFLLVYFCNNEQATQMHKIIFLLLPREYSKDIG
jgi:hypothetical protein